jgi:RNA polymerase sigma factor (sigma-70 family)
MPTSARDEEDLALSAFDSFYRAAEAGRFPQLRDSDAFWSLLITIAARKVANHIRAEKRQRRDIGRLAPNGALALELQVAEAPTPEIVTEAIDTFREILGKLDDGNLQTIAIKKMEGYSNQEIANELRCSLSTIERKVKLIRRHFSEEI